MTNFWAKVPYYAASEDGGIIVYALNALKAWISNNKGSGITCTSHYLFLEVQFKYIEDLTVFKLMFDNSFKGIKYSDNVG